MRSHHDKVARRHLGQGKDLVGGVSFGQPMPEDAMSRAHAASLACDFFLVAGSSLVVYPAAAFPLAAKRQGAAFAIVNRTATDHDRYADLVIQESTSVALPGVLALL